MNAFLLLVILACAVLYLVYMHSYPSSTHPAFTAAQTRHIDDPSFQESRSRKVNYDMWDLILSESDPWQHYYSLRRKVKKLQSDPSIFAFFFGIVFIFNYF